jgi:hypothetical protein
MAKVTEITDAADRFTRTQPRPGLSNPFMHEPSLGEIERQYIDHLRPADLIERRLISHLASIQYRLNCIIALALTHNWMESPGLSRTEFTLIRTRKTVLNTLATLRRHRPHPLRTQISNPCSKLSPSFAPFTSPAGLSTNPSLGSRKPRKSAHLDPAA